MNRTQAHKLSIGVFNQMSKSLLTAAFIVSNLLLGSLSFAGGISGSGGGSPLKYVEQILNPNSRVFVIDDTSFIDIISLIGDKNNDFSIEANIDLNSLMLKDGSTFVSAWRNTDGENIYFVSSSQYDVIKTNLTLPQLADQLDNDTNFKLLLP